MLNDSGIDMLVYDKRWGRYRMQLTNRDLATHRALMLDLIRRSSATPEPDDE